MVEGIVVISVMLCFIGLIVWARKVWGARIDDQMETRSTVLNAASHACEDEGQAGDTGASLPAAAAGGGGDAPKAMKTSTSWNVAKADRTDAVSWQAIFDKNAASNPGGGIDLYKYTLSANVRGYSNSVCNEPKYDSQLIAWAEYGLKFVTNIGGFAAALAIPGGPP